MNWFSNPWIIALLSAYYVWFSIGAWVMVVARAALRRMSRREVALLLTFLGFVAVESMQLKDLDLRGEMGRSLTRYFGAIAPLLWIWTAWALHALWSLRHPALKWAGRSAAVGFCLYVLAGSNIPFFVRQHEQGPAFDAYVAGALVAEEIAGDWNGPARRSCMMYSPGEYFTANLPAVFDTWGAAAWWVRGQSEGPCLNIYPYKPDYLLLCEEGGYRGDQSKHRPEDYRPMARVESTVCKWMLLKRISK